VGSIADMELAVLGQAKLLHVVERWLRRERDARHAKAAQEGPADGAAGAGGAVAPARTPYMPSKHLAFFR
jgi:CCR4-NOT complex subunit CAF16